MSADAIRLTGLRARGFHGVFEFEKREGQDFVADVVLFRDLSVPAASDDLADTADYGALADRLVQIIAGEPFDLIEALAGALADACLEFAPEAEVTVHKPQAPIAHEFADVAVTVRRRAAEAGSSAEEYEAVIALGANLGDARAALQDAAHALSLHPRIALVAGSSIFVTAPVGGVEQPDFHNAAVLVRTALPPRELLSVCQGIEVAAGRTREVRWGPRTLDLDLISARRAGGGGAEASAGAVTGAGEDGVAGTGAGRAGATGAVVWEDEVLSLPHPRAGERAFVLAPWAQLQADAIVDTPAGPRTVSQACEAAADASGIRDTAEPVIAPETA
ncbi:2-amino-4-hydroxy-6-hydroxymethyldihydropteridine diphosphokinase [Brevibacterium album]|uniref:2-amino-4-hydroxy-6- hydroxymethyldihydropteridine diphosphokinase n=1 Tax=Brevibacterium album TaxID=417948 RepID=UPI0004184E23|nr:2-amino-4-hydroxy-6-hydroxymethyldihydropteridine diphosphokinase [Brevibacterium album]